MPTRTHTAADNHCVLTCHHCNRPVTTGITDHPHQGPERLAMIAQKQAPFAAVLGCADSRVPTEILFDQGLGDVFVCR
jgi:carbonic anhydrase